MLLPCELKGAGCRWAPAPLASSSSRSGPGAKTHISQSVSKLSGVK